MLTIFTIPKPFVGHIGIIQRNAVHSWSCLRPRCEIILCADEPGTEEAAAEFGAKHIADVARNEYGTPLLDSVFEQVEEAASHDLICYVNADIILLSDFARAVHRLAGSKRLFLMVGRRRDVDISERLDFGPGWEERLRAYIAWMGRLYPREGIDYFVFRRGSMGKLPPFAVGRPAWDNWFIYRARKLGIPVVDATRVVTAAHQNHGYDHVPKRRDDTWGGPEGDRNRELAGAPDCIFTLLDATHVMTSRRLLPALGYLHLRRRLRTLPILVPSAAPLERFMRTARARARALLRGWVSHGVNA